MSEPTSLSARPVNEQPKAYLVGGGIGSLAAAAFLIRDGQVPGGNIWVLEAGTCMGGSLDAGFNACGGYSMRGGRMLTSENYECTWDLFRSIPSLRSEGLSVYAETLRFNERHETCAQARLVDRHRGKVPVTSMGFTLQDRVELLKLTMAAEGELGSDSITDWFSSGFFESRFWCLWATTFGFQPWHSAAELRRYLHRFMLEFSRIETLAGVKRTLYNQHDSLVLPLQAWLEDQGVHLVSECLVTDIETRAEGELFFATGLQCQRPQGREAIALEKGDLVFLQNGSMTDASSLGTMSSAPAKLTKADSNGWALWEKLAARRPEFGNPRAFNSCIAQSNWESFTVTLRHSTFFEKIYKFTGNHPGSGGLVTFKDSRWRMSIVLPHQPHFLDQPGEVQVFWGYALFPDRIGDFVPKAMADCSGAEILEELCGHLKFDLESAGAATCIPCAMPYITSMFMPREPGDRPLPVPIGSSNLAFISQFVEIPDDVVFTVEYSVRAAQMAVYQLLGLSLPIPPVTRHDQSIRTRLKALCKAFA